MFGRLHASADLSAKLEALDRSQAVIEFAPDGTVLTANANFLTIMGYTLDEIRGRPHGMFVDAAHRERADYAAFWDDLRRGATRPPSSSASPRTAARSGSRAPTTPSSTGPAGDEDRQVRG